ncbi:hypothetical protein [Methylomonas sp. AM2-LC]|uniref:hypothetical protein n=1 Tax=Methylomonas sp. AM2-LC TaxID=3153301 RepID=UPI0032654FC3
MPKVNELQKHLQPGQIYRRADLTKWSNAVDRHLQQLVSKGVIQKLAGGLYYCPKKTVFGDAPPEDEMLVRAFLKDDHFYMASLNTYNSLGVGTTQLYNEKLVYNHKRDGRYTLNGRQFYFLKRSRFPEKSSQEFLLVDLINNLHFLAEDKESIIKRVAEKVRGMDKAILMKVVQEYAGARTQSFFEKLFRSDDMKHAV